MEAVNAKETVVAYRPEFKAISGTVTAGLLLAQLLYWAKGKNAAGRNGWFFKTIEELVNETGLSKKEQTNARKRLSDLKLVEETRKHTAVPNGRYVRGAVWFRVNLELLIPILEQHSSDVKFLTELRAVKYCVSKAVETVKEKVKRTFKVAVKMGKKAFNGKNEAKPLTDTTRLKLEYDNAQYRHVVENICSTACEMFPGDNPLEIATTVEAHIEFWMQQAKKNKRLKLTMGQLREKYIERKKEGKLAPKVDDSPRSTAEKLLDTSWSNDGISATSSEEEEYKAFLAMGEAA